MVTYKLSIVKCFTLRQLPVHEPVLNRLRRHRYNSAPGLLNLGHVDGSIIDYLISFK